MIEASHLLGHGEFVEHLVHAEGFGRDDRGPELQRGRGHEAAEADFAGRAAAQDFDLGPGHRLVGADAHPHLFLDGQAVADFERGHRAGE